MKIFLSTFLILANFYLAHSQSTPTNAYYIGHSLSDYIPEMVKSLADAHQSAQFDWSYQSIPGAPLAYQWTRKETNDYTNNPPYYYAFWDQVGGLPAGDYDVMVLTEGVPRYQGNIIDTYQYADSFYVYANNYNPDIQVYLYEDWHCINSGTPTGCDYDVDSNPWRERLEDDLPMWESVVDYLNNKYAPSKPVCLIPAAQGLATVYDSIYSGALPGITDISDLFSDDIHLNNMGRYFVACVHFAEIFDASPVGLPNQLQNAWGGNFANPPSAALATAFQEIAWQTVSDYYGPCDSYAPSCGSATVSEPPNNNMTMNLSSSCDLGLWTYYQHNGQTHFSIDWASNNTNAKSVATISITTGDMGVAQDIDKATYTMSTYWNVDIGNQMLLDPVSVRFYFSPTDTLDVYNLAQNFALDYDVPIEASAWFKTVGVSFDPNAINAGSPGQGAIELTPIYGLENSVSYVQFDGITSFSGGTYAVGAGQGSNGLPLKIVDFYAEESGNKNRISWRTLSTDNVYYIELEHSYDGKNWSPIKRINYNEINNIVGDKCNFYDDNPYHLTYYRLKSIDIDGSVDVSKVIVCNRNNSFSDWHFNLFPNPSYSMTSLNVNSYKNEILNIELKDMRGKILDSFNHTIYSGINEIKIDISNVEAGSYIVQVKSQGQQQVLKLIKL